MSKYMVTVGASTGAGAVVQSTVTTATINRKPIATVGSIASHPLGADVLVQGIPTILLNGQPISFSTAKTALGGCVIANTSVKISSPSFESYIGFTPAPRIEQQSLSDEQEAKKVSEKENPEESKDYTLESNYAQQELIKIAKQDGLYFFQLRMIQIFGKDVSPKALEKLYTECVQGSIENPEIVVCKNKIHGLRAAYNNKTHKVYISEGAIKAAMDDNEKRHVLMAALIEEYGHHIDYLLRFVFDKNKNADAKHDEGARFAYQAFYNIHYVDHFNTKETLFAKGTAPSGKFDLAFEYAELNEVLNQYTAKRQENTNDHVGDHWEGFKVEDLSKSSDIPEDERTIDNTKGFGHKNIQKMAVKASKIELFVEYSDFLYRGNWLRDYSQLLSPMLLHGLGQLRGDSVKEIVANAKRAIKDMSADAILIKDNEPYNALLAPKNSIPLLTDMIRLMAIDQFFVTPMAEVGLYYPLITKAELDADPNVWRKLVNGIGSESDSKGDSESDSKARKDSEKLIEAKKYKEDRAAEQKCWKEEKEKAKKENRADLKEIEQEYYKALAASKRADVEYEKIAGIIPGFDELLGVGVPHDHFDNPFGLGENKKLHQYFKDNNLADQYGVLFNKAIAPYETELSDTYGTKNYIRNCKDDPNYKSTIATTELGSKVVYDHLTDRLTEVCTTGFDFDQSIYDSMKNMTRLGGFLHTVQDFYAHSNYAEVYLAQRWFDKVYTWTLADQTRDYTKKRILSGTVLVDGLIFGSRIKNPKARVISSLGRPAGSPITRTGRESGKMLYTEPENNPIINASIKAHGDGLFEISQSQKEQNALDEKVAYMKQMSSAEKGLYKVNKKAFYAPITSGTYDLEDMFATFMSMLSDILLPIEKKKDREKEKEKKANNRRELLIQQNAGDRTSLDLKLLTLCRFYDQMAKEGGNREPSEAEKKYNEFLDARDALFEKYRENIEFTLPVFQERINLNMSFESIFESLKSGLYNVIDLMDEHTPEPIKKIVRKLVKAIQDSMEAFKREIMSTLHTFVSHLTAVGVLVIASYQLSIKEEMNALLKEMEKTAEEEGVSAVPLVFQTKMGGVLKTGAQRALRGQYPIDNNPSHTMLAKDEASHPIHVLTGKMAYASTLELLKFIDQDVPGKKANKSLDVLSKVIAHPLQDQEFDDIVDKWGMQNPLNVLKLCVSSYFFETLRLAIVHSEDFRATLNNHLDNTILIGIKRLLAEIEEHLPQPTVNVLGETAKTLKALYGQLVNAYAKSTYRELDGETFKEWYRLYEEKRHPQFPPLDEASLNARKEEWLKAVDSELKKVVKEGWNYEFNLPDMQASIMRSIPALPWNTVQY